MTPEQKAWIDGRTYEGLLHRWRFAPVGDSMFTGDTGEYYSKVMQEKKAALSGGEQVQASKNAGWEKP